MAQGKLFFRLNQNPETKLLIRICANSAACLSHCEYCNARIHLLK